MGFQGPLPPLLLDLVGRQLGHGAAEALFELLAPESAAEKNIFVCLVVVRLWRWSPTTQWRCLGDRGARASLLALRSQ